MDRPRMVRGERRESRRRAPRLESLESRELLTFTLAHRYGELSSAALAGIQGRVTQQAQVASQSQGSSDGTNSSAATGSGSGFAGTGDTTGTLTPHEVRRQTYQARFKGSYQIGPGRTTDQKAQFLSLGYGGGNQALHILANMRLTVPADPTVPVTGVVYIIAPSVATTGTQLILDLTGDPSSAVNGIPTHYTWTVDPSSAGIYSNAAGYGTGNGTLNIQFFPKRPAGASLAPKGKLQYAINGLIDTGGGIFNDIGVLGNIPKNP